LAKKKKKRAQIDLEMLEYEHTSQQITTEIQFIYVFSVAFKMQHFKQSVASMRRGPLAFGKGHAHVGKHSLLTIAGGACTIKHPLIDTFY
jgi:hypothetical protein